MSRYHAKKNKEPSRLFQNDGDFVPDNDSSRSLLSSSSEEENVNSRQHQISMYYPVYVMIKTGGGGSNLVSSCISCLGGGSATHCSLYDVASDTKYTADLYRKKSYSAPMDDDIRKFSGGGYNFYSVDMTEEEHGRLIRNLKQNEGQTYDTCMARCAFWSLCCSQSCLELCCTSSGTQTCARYVNEGLKASGIYERQQTRVIPAMVYCEKSNFIFPTAVERNMEGLSPTFEQVTYQEMAQEILDWRKKFGITPAGINLVQGDDGPDFMFME